MLRGELERHSVPYYMVRTKVDQDIANNKEEPWMGQLSESTPRIHKDLILGPLDLSYFGGTTSMSSTDVRLPGHQDERTHTPVVT